MESKKEEKIKSHSFFSDIKNVRRNMNVVRNSPYAALKFKYYMALALIVALSGFFIYQFISIVIKYNGGSSAMTLMGRGFVLLILVIILWKSWAMLKPIKNTIKQYEAHPEHQNVYQQKDVRAEIDDILNRFDDKNERRLKK